MCREASIFPDGCLQPRRSVNKAHALFESSVTRKVSLIFVDMDGFVSNKRNGVNKTYRFMSAVDIQPEQSIFHLKYPEKT